jgi:hypothetical protein
MTNVRELLAPICRLDGIWATFVLSGTGQLKLWDVPRVLTEEALDQVSTPLVSLCDALGRGYSEIDFCVLRFAKHRLCLHATADGMVCIVASPAVNMPALKTAAAITLRRLGPLLQPGRGEGEHV